MVSYHTYKLAPQESARVYDSFKIMKISSLNLYRLRNVPFALADADEMCTKRLGVWSQTGEMQTSVAVRVLGTDIDAADCQTVDERY